MKRAILLVSLVLLLGSIPPTMARHRSVGFEDQVAISPDDEPTVPNDGQVGQDTSEADTPYEVGTIHPSECYETSGNLSEQEITRTLSADAYCGELVYNEDLDKSLEVVSPLDQDIPASVGGDVGETPIGTFDVVRTDLIAPFPGGLTLCQPFCKPDAFTGIPGGNQRHEVFYDTASQTGVVNDSDETSEQQRNNRRQYTSVQLAYPNAAQKIQRETGLWEMNGWANPNVEHDWVGFLEDKNGEPISDDRLKSIVQAADLPADAVPKLCGFTEDRDISTTKSDNFCEQELKYFDNGDSATRGDFTEYGDRCNSPTYVCNAAGGPAWRDSPPSFLGAVSSPYLGSADHINTPFVSFTLGDEDKFVTWHWVVAPSPQDCVAQEPVVQLENDDGSTAPYLAHDLDSYVPSVRIDGADTPSPDHVEDYANRAADGPIDTVVEGVNNNTDLPPAVEQAIDQAVATGNAAVNETVRQISAAQNQTIGDVTKPSRVEPNADPAQNPVADDSRSHVSVERSLEGACQRAVSSEVPETVDPWTDLVDSGISVTRPTSVGVFGIGASVEGLYGNADPNQDDENNPGPARVTTTGNVGLFTDKNDDGDYDATGDPYGTSNIVNTGAYPMLWDIRVEQTESGPQITEDGACEFTDTQTTNLAADAKRLGYGPNTGLFQLVYLQEPTQADTDIAAVEDRIVYSSGNNIYLLASQAVKELWEGPAAIDPGASDDTAIDNEVDSAIRDLQDYADAKNGGQAAPSVEVPGAAFGLDSDYGNQCAVNTGGFTSKISFLHDCKQMNCTGDTVLTKYVFQVTTEDGTLNEGNFVPGFSGLNDQTAKFDGFAPQNVWTDVDPLDGDPDRNDDNTDRPPT